MANYTPEQIEAVKEEADKRREHELKLAGIEAMKAFALKHPYLDTIQTLGKRVCTAACWIAFFWFFLT